jgi:four helix bundle protein
MLMIQSFRDLTVWQKSMDLAQHVYQSTERFPRSEMFGLTSQVRRAAVSIPSNIAEGKAIGGNN